MLLVFLFLIVYLRVSPEFLRIKLGYRHEIQDRYFWFMRFFSISRFDETFGLGTLSDILLVEDFPKR